MQTSLCAKCLPNCIKCLSFEYCLECDTTFKLLSDHSDCKANCPDGHDNLVVGQFFDSGSAICKNCYSNCKICDTATTCYECFDGLYLNK